MLFIRVVKDLSAAVYYITETRNRSLHGVFCRVTLFIESKSIMQISNELWAPWNANLRSIIYKDEIHNGVL